MLKFPEKFVPLCKLLQKELTFSLTQSQKDCIFDMNENLAKAAKLSFRLRLADKQLVIMCGASGHAADYVLLIEDYTEKDGVSLKSYALVAFGSHVVYVKANVFNDVC